MQSQKMQGKKSYKRNFLIIHMRLLYAPCHFFLQIIFLLSIYFCSFPFSSFIFSCFLFLLLFVFPLLNRNRDIDQFVWIYMCQHCCQYIIYTSIILTHTHSHIYVRFPFVDAALDTLTLSLPKPK